VDRNVDLVVPNKVATGCDRFTNMRPPRRCVWVLMAGFSLEEGVGGVIVQVVPLDNTNLFALAMLILQMQSTNYVS